MLETIIGPAIRCGDVIYDLPAPNRHHHIFALHCKEYKGVIVSTIADGEQGFMTSAGRFVDREEGMIIATAADQVKFHSGAANSKKLYTEDMW